MNTYKTSDGSRLKQSIIDSLIKKAKAEKLRQQFDEHRYNFCEDCGISSGTYLDCSHDESVKKCKENGRTEKAFDVNNITIRCRKCHQIHDKTV
jgi:hypothetical protein